MKRLILLFGAVFSIAAGDPSTEREHVVEEGETLKGIANRAGVPDVVIAEANGLAEPYVVKLGQKLVIPRQQVHTVKAGDTLSQIAERYHVPASQIALANGLGDADVVRLGQRLIIPAVLPEREASAAPGAPYFRRPHDGKVLLGWKRRPDGGGHAGIDFAVATGDMIRAAASGTVISAGDDASRWGKLVIVDHGNGWQSAYGELARMTVEPGEAIKAGERLGIGGAKKGSAKGNDPAAEFHFDIRHDGELVDPAPLLRPGG